MRKFDSTFVITSKSQKAPTKKTDEELETGKLKKPKNAFLEFYHAVCERKRQGKLPDVPLTNKIVGEVWNKLGFVSKNFGCIFTK